LIHHYQASRDVEDSGPVEVRFFGGDPPTDEQIQACNGLPFTARVRPDRLTRAQADRLRLAGATCIELDVWTFDDAALRAADRRYRSALVKEMAQGLSAQGLNVGIVLCPGLPNSSYETCIEDAKITVGLADTCRIHPTLVFRDSRLREKHEMALFEPLALGETVTVCAEMTDILEEGGVLVIRIGMQPGPDELGVAVAGPKHSSLRQLVESRRTLKILDTLFSKSVAPGGKAVITCHPRDETRTRGPFNQHIRTLRSKYKLREVFVRVTSSFERGQWSVEVES
jgi:hypothetical protein